MNKIAFAKRLAALEAAVASAPPPDDPADDGEWDDGYWDTHFKSVIVKGYADRLAALLPKMLEEQEREKARRAALPLEEQLRTLQEDQQRRAARQASMDRYLKRKGRTPELPMSRSYFDALNGRQAADLERRIKERDQGPSAQCPATNAKTSVA